MPLDTTTKQQLIGSHQIHATDTGSVEVQVAMLTERVSKLSGHLQQNKHDFSSRQGLLKMIGRRKRLLTYLRSMNETRYKKLIQQLGIRG
uniref:30S ribosomal protein S15 n=1 Tax=Paulinella longichromatophora TaxID=1708747 RepID=A0A2H4ZNJ2_9EUKA|nr:30S ribosomal protein S15 [Paulinella longichromatophora]